MKKSQVATEFMLMVSLAIVVIIALMGVLFYLFTNYSEDKNLKRLTDLGYSLQSEFILAAQVEPGYERNITLPSDVEGMNYSIKISSNEIVLTFRVENANKKTDLLFLIPNVTGSITTTGVHSITTTASAIIIS